MVANKSRPVVTRPTSILLRADKVIEASPMPLLWGESSSPDIPAAPSHVRHWGYSGHRYLGPLCPLMTQSDVGEQKLFQNADLSHYHTAS